MPVTVGFVSLGCPKNTVDSERMLALMGQEGLLLSADTDNADVVVINTCGFIESAKQEALETIRHAVGLKEKGQIRKVIAAGCLAQRMGPALGQEVEGIDAIVGLGERDRIATIVQEITAEKNEPVYLQAAQAAIHDDRNRLRITPSHYAYLRVSEGCNRNCTFCTIPSIRGEFISKPLETVVDEARELVASGAKELILIAQDTIFYGRDIGLKNGLVQLLNQLEQIDGLEWIRVMYLYPASVDDAFINCLAESEKVIHYIDMPVQHINDTILRAMRRSDTRKRTMSVIEKLRAAMPDMVLRTTVMVGFPGETDAQFDELLNFIRWARIDMLGSFTYQREPGTPAHDLPAQLPEDVKEHRRDQVMLAQQEIAYENNDKRMGEELDVVIDEAGDPGFATGRYFGQAPEIDSVCLMENVTGQVGDTVPTRVIGSDEYDLIVEQY
jgi:ribosomal protein S12 methylthiotransferase